MKRNLEKQLAKLEQTPTSTKREDLERALEINNYQILISKQTSEQPTVEISI